ncbi:methyl-accepting chemotaxis protein [Clostridium lundense]|uniref:methyl-accepting chemotaxis protein n=1 Tax=Clostridium lundense TaxID=319475 RepID=UPI00048583B7|nr:methyl-accepting chemotaxis protein [Clostridium lundense]
MTLKKKLPIIISLIIFLSLSLTGTINYIQSSKAMIDSTKNSMISINERVVSTMNTIINREQTLVTILSNRSNIIALMKAHNSSKLDDNYKKLIQSNNEWLKGYVKEVGNIEHAFIVDSKGLIISDSEASTIGKNVLDRDYHKTTMNGSKSIGSLVVSKSTGKQIIVFTSPIKVNNEILGYVGTAVLAESFSEHLSNININNTKGSYGYLLDSKGIMIYHKDLSKIGKPVENESIKKVVSDISSGKTLKPASVEYTYNNAKKVAAYNFVDKTNWILVITSDYNEIISPITKLTRIIIIVSFLAIIISILIATFISNKITTPIIKISRLVDKTSNLDLEHDNSYDEYSKYNDEIGIIFKSTTAMRENLREMINQLSSISNSINNNANMVEKLTAELKLSSTETNTAIEGLTAAMEESAATIEEVSASSTEIENAVNLMAHKATEGSINANEISDKADNMQVSSKKAKENSITVYYTVKDELSKAIDGARSVSKVNELAESILNITGQTNLLALNAAIEAARAGEAGKGFAVVAEEVRKLAEESSKTASNIQTIIKQVNSSVLALIESSNKILEFIDKEVTKDYDILIQTAEEYKKDANNYNEVMTEFSATSEELTASITGIAKAIGEMSLTINSSTDEITSISDKSSSLNEKVLVIENTSIENKNSVTVLQSIIDKFKI